MRGTALRIAMKITFRATMHHASLNGAPPPPPPEPLQVIITGTAGSGKSYLINAIKARLGDTCILTGTTGLAGYNI